MFSLPPRPVWIGSFTEFSGKISGYTGEKKTMANELNNVSNRIACPYAFVFPRVLISIK